MIRKLYTLAVICFFLFMMSRLAIDHIIPSLNRDPGINIDRRVLMDSWVNQDDYYYLYLDQLPLGAMHSTAEAETEGLKEEEEYYTTSAHIKVDFFLFKARIIMSAELNRRLELQEGRLRAHIPSPGSTLYSAEQLDQEELPSEAYEAAVLVKGRTLYLRLRRDEAVQYRQMHVPRPLTMSDSISPILRGQMMSRDTVYSLDIYEPLWGGSAGQAQVEWVDTKRITDEEGTGQRIRIVEVRYRNLKMVLHVDPAGNIVRREIPVFSGGGTEASGEAISGSRLIMVRQEATDAISDYPGLVYIPEPPDYEVEDFIGEDSGQVIRLSAFSMLSGGLKEMNQ